MSERKTSFQPEKIELYTYDEGSKTFTPIGEDNGIPVRVVGGAVGGGGSAMDFLHGSGEPAQDVGANGDVFLNADNGDLYKKESGAWNFIINLKGKDGVDGKDGTNGVDGKDGATGAKGDKGDKGDTGAKGDKGDKGDTGATGANGKDGINGVDGKDGFMSEAEYNSLLSTISDMQAEIEALKGE